MLPESMDGVVPLRGCAIEVAARSVDGGGLQPVATLTAGTLAGHQSRVGPHTKMLGDRLPGQMRTRGKTRNRLRLFAEQLERFGIKPEHWQVLVGIYRAGIVAPHDLAAYTGADASTITRRVDRLVRLGLVRRVPCPGDRRSIRLELTTEGKRLTPRIARVARALNDEVLGDAGDGERRRLQRTLRAMLERLGEPEPRDCVAMREGGTRR